MRCRTESVPRYRFCVIGAFVADTAIATEHNDRMVPGSIVRAVVKDARVRTIPQWMDAAAWALFAFGMLVMLPDSVPAVLVMITAAATYRLLPEYAFAAAITASCSVVHRESGAESGVLHGKCGARPRPGVRKQRPR